MGFRTFVTTRRKRTLVLSGVAVLALAGVGVWVFGFAIPGGSDSAAAATSRTVTASLETIEKTVEGTGTLTPAVQDDVDFAVSGTVTGVSVKAGDTVAAGDTLATVDTLQLNADLLSAKADLADAEATLSDLGSSASSSKTAAAQAAVDVAQSKETAAEDAMADATLTAPSAGLVTSVGIDVGDAVSGSGSSDASGSSSGASSSSTGGSTGGTTGSSTTTTSSAAFSIVSTDAWTVDVSVGESDVANVKADQQVELSTDDGDSFFGTVTEVGLVPSTTDGTAEYPVTITVTGEPDNLHDGVSVTADIVYERRTDVLTVPSAAITTDDDGSSVLLVGDEGTTKTTVTLGETSGTVTEILTGLSEGDSVEETIATPGNQGGTGTQQGTQQGGGEQGFPDMQGGQTGQMPTGGFGGNGTGNR